MSDETNPGYYTAGGMQAIDVIEEFGLGFHRGNAVKYILRAGRKGDVALDLRKAVWYLQRELDGLSGSGGGKGDAKRGPGFGDFAGVPEKGAPRVGNGFGGLS